MGDENSNPNASGSAAGASGAEFEVYTPLFGWCLDEPVVSGFVRGCMFQHPGQVKTSAVFIPRADAVTTGCAHLEGKFFQISNQLLVAKEDMKETGPYVAARDIGLSSEARAAFVASLTPEDRARAAGEVPGTSEGPKGSIWLRLKKKPAKEGESLSGKTGAGEDRVEVMEGAVAGAEVAQAGVQKRINASTLEKQQVCSSPRLHVCWCDSLWSGIWAYQHLGPQLSCMSESVVVVYGDRCVPVCCASKTRCVSCCSEHVHQTTRCWSPESDPVGSTACLG